MRMKKRSPWIYIPFLGDKLHYGCRVCGAGCCRTSGTIAFTRGQKKALAERFPNFRYFFVTGSEATVYSVRRYSQCIALGKDGVCSIHERSGFYAKPLMCRMHPFHVTRCPAGLIVIPVNCAMLYAAGKDSSSVQKSEVLRTAAEAARHGLFYEDQKIDWTKGRLDREKAVLVSSQRFLGEANYLSFAAFQRMLLRPKGSAPAMEAELLDSVKLWDAFLGVGLDLENKRRTFELTVFTPLLRVASTALNSLEEDEAASALLALYVYSTILFDGERARGYFGTYLDLLHDVAIGLSLLKKSDLAFRSKPTEYKVNYLRMLRALRLKGAGKKIQSLPRIA